MGDSWNCWECNEDTFSEYYMLLQELWDEYGNNEGLLCIRCFERRLGRELNVADFADVPLNELGNGWSKSERFIDRLMRMP